MYPFTGPREFSNHQESKAPESDIPDFSSVFSELQRNINKTLNSC